MNGTWEWVFAVVAYGLIIAGLVLRDREVPHD